jgi:TadE-like protein
MRKSQTGARGVPRRGAEPAAGRRRRSEAGSVTAEFAVGLPAVVVVLALCLGGIQTVGQQLRLLDAAADAARLLARGDGADAARDHASRAVGVVSFTAEAEGDFRCVHLSATATFLPARALGVPVSATSCALGGQEDRAGRPE